MFRFISCMIDRLPDLFYFSAYALVFKQVIQVLTTLAGILYSKL